MKNRGGIRLLAEKRCKNQEITSFLAEMGEKSGNKQVFGWKKENHRGQKKIKKMKGKKKCQAQPRKTVN